MNLDIFGLFKQEIRPALGCTEPAAVALACAAAAEQLQGSVCRVLVQTDIHSWDGQDGALMGSGAGSAIGQAGVGAAGA